jgi:hypothetical protein
MPRFEIEGRAVVLDRLPCHAMPCRATC